MNMMSIFYYVIKIKLKGRFFLENFYTNRQCLLSLFVKVVFLSNKAFGSVSRNKFSSRPSFCNLFVSLHSDINNYF